MATGDDIHGEAGATKVFLLFVDQGSCAGGSMPRIELMSVMTIRTISHWYAVVDCVRAKARGR